MWLSNVPFQFLSFSWHQIPPVHNRITLPKLLDWLCLCPKFTCVSFVFCCIPWAQHKEQPVKKQYVLNKQTAYNCLSPD